MRVGPEPADARARARGRVGDVRPRALPRPRARRRARLRGLRAHARARRRRRAADDRRPRVPGANDDARAASPRCRWPPRCPAPIRRRFDRADSDALHFPLSVMIPASTPARGDDRARPPARALSAVLLARRARLPPRGLRLDGEAQPLLDRHLGAREATLARAVRTEPGARPHDSPRHRPRTVHPGRQ